MNDSPEKLLIQIYKHLTESRVLTEKLIDYLGNHQYLSIKLPKDIEQLIQVALKLSPEKRKKLLLYLESLT